MTRNKHTIEVVAVRERRLLRWSTAEKTALVREIFEPGMSVSTVERQHGVSVSTA